MITVISPDVFTVLSTLRVVRKNVNVGMDDLYRKIKREGGISDHSYEQILTLLSELRAVSSLVEDMLDS